jgi:hypothetical protein
VSNETSNGLSEAIIEGQRIQWAKKKEKRQPMIYETLHRNLKIE